MAATLAAMNEQLQLWAGSQHSFEVYVQAMAQVNSPRALAFFDREEDERPVSRLLQVQGNVGIINIAGTTVAGAAGFMRYFGVVGYDDIREALGQAISNPKIGAIVMNWDSNGGQVAGVHDSAKLIAQVNKIKPVISYNGGDMLSAALWQAAGSKLIYASETARTGSIGIIQMHAEKTKMLEADGIKVTVIRAGSEKALQNPYEVLSDKARAAMQREADVTYDVFMPWVAQGRGATVEVAESRFGQGVIFVGKDAQAAGLVDKIGSLEDAYMEASKLATKVLNKAGATNVSRTPKIASASRAAVGNNSATAQGNPMPRILTDEQMQAMAAAGVPFEDTPEDTTADAASKAAAAAAAEEKKAETPDGKAAAQDTGSVTMLQGMLATAQAQVGKLTGELEVAKAAANAAAGKTAPFVAVVRKGVKAMGVSFGVTAAAVDAMSDDEVLTEHTRLGALVAAKFKTGGVSVQATEDKDNKGASEKFDLPLAFAIATRKSTK